MHNRFDNRAQVVAVDLRVVPDGFDAFPGSLLHGRNQLRKRIGRRWLIIEADVLGGIPIAVIVEETGIVGQPMLFRVHRHAVHRRQYTSVERAVLSIVVGKMRSQSLFCGTGIALVHYPLAQLRHVGEVMQRGRVARDVHQHPRAGDDTKGPDVGCGVAIQLQSARRDGGGDSGRCLQWFDRQRFPRLIHR
ncbi:hypothetical protein D3C84_647060 [compost metagenome]